MLPRKLTGQLHHQLNRAVNVKQFLGMLALLPIEKIINGLASHDPHVVEQLRGFDSKAIEILSHSPSVSIFLLFDEGNIKLSAIDSADLMLEPDATISGKAADLLELLFTRPEHRPLANTAISIGGDAVLVQELYNVLSSLDLDWEDYLAPVLGDILSNEVGKFSREAKNFSQTTSSNMRRNVHDYLVEESRAVPAREELNRFNDDLDLLRLNIDRAAARAEQIGSRLERLTKSS